MSNKVETMTFAEENTNLNLHGKEEKEIKKKSSLPGFKWWFSAVTGSGETEALSWVDFLILCL